MPKLQTATLTNQNISAALLVGTFTAGAEYSSLMVNIMLDQIAGNGNYIAYLTHQLSGAGSAYPSALTTDAVPNGVTSHKFASILLPVNSGDVIKVYVTGLAGDTTTPDITCEFWDLGYLRPATAGRTLAVASTGQVGIDYTNVNGSPSDTSGVTTLLTRIVGTLLAGSHNPQSGDSFARIGAPNGASLVVDVATRLATSAYTAPANASIATILADYARRTGDYATPEALATLQSNVTTILADYARRTGDYSTLVAGAKMDIVDAPNATAITAIQSGLSKPGMPQTITAPADMALNSTVAKDATVMKAAGYTAPDNSGISDIKAKTDNLPANPASQTNLDAAVSSRAKPSDISNITIEASLAVSATQAEDVASGSLSVMTWYRFVQDITTTMTSDLASANKLWFALKNADDEDAASFIFIEKTAGLTVVAGKTYPVNADGALVVSGSSGAWVITVRVNEAATALLQQYANQEFRAELKAEINGIMPPVPVWSGVGVIRSGIVRAIV